jgi:hypothetical protein
MSVVVVVEISVLMGTENLMQCCDMGGWELVWQRLCGEKLLESLESCWLWE